MMSRAQRLDALLLVGVLLIIACGWVVVTHYTYKHLQGQIPTTADMPCGDYGPGYDVQYGVDQNGVAVCYVFDFNTETGVPYIIGMEVLTSTEE